MGIRKTFHIRVSKNPVAVASSQVVVAVAADRSRAAVAAVRKFKSDFQSRAGRVARLFFYDSIAGTGNCQSSLAMGSAPMSRKTRPRRSGARSAARVVSAYKSYFYSVSSTAATRLRPSLFAP